MSRGALWLSLRWVFADSLDRLQAGVELLSELRPWSVRLTLLGIVILLLGTAQHLIQVRRRHLALLPCYPPTWLAAALGVVVVAALGLAPVIPGATSWRDALGVWLHLGLLVAAALGALWLYSSLSQRHLASLRGGTGLRPAAPPVAEASLPPRLRLWLTPEQPVASADHDALSRQAVADRLAVVLRQPATRTIGLIGGFGAGKSSVLSLLQRRLEDRSDASATPIWYCQVSCWGFDDTSAAIDRVLSAAIERIEREVDCLAVRDLPKSYLDAFVVVHKALKPLLSAFHGSHDAKKTLRRLDSLLAIAGARLVIAMEDIERNGKLDTLQFQALLDNLRSMQNVTFILVAVTASALDFTRLCDHVESLPNLPPEDVWDWLIDYRDHLVQSRPRIVDPVAPEARLRKTLRFAGLSDALARQAGALLATPRLLKRAMQRFRRAWDAVGGEVDVDDLLILSILRTAAPSAVDFLQDNVGRIRTAIVNARRAATPIGEGADATLHALQIQWEACGQRIAASNDAVDLGGVEAFVDFLVPGLGPGFKNPRGGRPPAPQGVLGADHCDYWRRAYDERVDSTVADQEILVDYHRLATGQAEVAELAGRMVQSDDRATVYSYYLSQCSREDRLNLAAAVVSRLGTERDPGPAVTHFAYQRVVNCAMALAEPSKSDGEWIRARLNESARGSLGFANQFFAHMAGSGGMLGSQETANELRRRGSRTSASSSATAPLTWPRF